MSRLLLNSKPVKLLLIFTLAMVVLSPMTRPFQTVSAQSTNNSQQYDKQFVWDYGGHHWVWNLSIPANLFNAYQSVQDDVRTQIPLSRFGYFTTTSDSFMQQLAQNLNSTAHQYGYSSLDELNFVLSFVQSIPYATDANSTGYQDYPRFPVETLVDDIGDCKSHSVLFATLSIMLGYGAIFINPPDHLAVGILGDNLSGTYWTYQNQNYYYCETTGSGFTIGQLPTEFNGQSAYAYGIDTTLQYIVDLQSNSYGQPNPTIDPNTNSNNPTPTPGAEGPNAVPIAPISLDLISKDPLLFTVIIIAIGAAIAVTVMSAKNARQPRTLPSESNSAVESSKFCIYCGASNKSFAVYCETCGKKIG
jgi:hypothetical protein